MRTLPIIKIALVMSVATVLNGCLVSDEPVLTAANATSSPWTAGVYIACPEGADADPEDCQTMTIAAPAQGLYTLTAEGEDEVIEMRFRRVARGGYAVQSNEGADGYAYYYATGASRRMTLTMMMCADLPVKIRNRLVDRGDLTTEDDNFSTCSVKTLRGLMEPAKAYYRGDADSDDAMVIGFTPAPAESAEAP